MVTSAFRPKLRPLQGHICTVCMPTKHLTHAKIHLFIENQLYRSTLCTKSLRNKVYVLCVFLRILSFVEYEDNFQSRSKIENTYIKHGDGSYRKLRRTPHPNITKATIRMEVRELSAK